MCLDSGYSNIFIFQVNQYITNNKRAGSLERARESLNEADVGESSFRSLMVVVQRCAICVSSFFYLYLFGDSSILQEESVIETRIFFLFSLINSRANISYGHMKQKKIEIQGNVALFARKKSLYI